ncbi:MAG: response regulator, partial [Deltaproteobacteria bacterium]|nr:response regulator [Nannocystaceae bacterium]
ERAKLDADAANRAKSDFLANMSHEIRTPMSVVLGYADLLLERVAVPEDRACVETIRRNGLFLLRIVNDILDLSKIEAGTLLTEHVRFSPGELLLELRELLDERVRERGLPLRIELAGPIPETIEGDPTRMRQVLVNLVGNGIKFTDEGEVRVLVELHRERGELELTVSDTGIGMDEELQRRLFVPFNQADTSNTRRHGGTGLGLAISKRLVDAMGGRISAQSEPGVGSTFRFTVPTGPLGGVGMIDALPVRDPAPPGQAVARTLAGRTVLLVDDVSDVRNLLKSYLGDAGAQVVEAGDGAAALVAFEAMRREHRLPDVVLLDMQMPVLDGYDTARGLRSLGHAKPIIALTAAAMKGDRERCLDAGCDDYLTKPVSRDALLECVTRHCSDPTAGATYAAAEESHARQVLLVEDNEDAAVLLATLLEHAGYRVRHAATGAEAIALATELAPAAVLLDIGLPDMDGFTVLSRMRELPSLAGTLFIALSGHGPDAHPWREAGFHHHVEKPGSVARLRELLPRLPAG